MKLNSFKPHWLLISLIALLTLSACERPVPRDENTETTNLVPTTETIIIPTAPPATVEPDAAATSDAGETSTNTTPSESPDASDAGSETETGAEPPATGDEEITHTVKADETLGLIAQIYGVSIEDIAAANNITDIHSLDVGQTLVIKAGAAGSGNEDDTTNEAGERVHIVQAGDNLFRIGLRYGFTAEELAAYNNIPNPARIDVGQVIKIPPNE